MKKTLLLLIPAVIFFGCSKDDEVVNNPPPSTSGTHVISAGGTSFTPNTLTAKVGDTLSFVWSSGSHTTTSTSIPAGAGAWNVPLNSTSTSFNYIITKTGIYNFKCTPHESMGMTGKVTVN